MRVVAPLLCAAFFAALMQQSAWAQEAGCKLVESGYNYVNVEEQSEAWSYGLAMAGANWRTVPFGWHATGFLTCSDCSPKAFAGPYHLFYRSGAAGLPSTASERIERDEGKTGTAGSDRLRHYATHEPLVVGPLSGHAVLYRFRIPARDSASGNSQSNAGDRTVGLISLHVADACVVFQTQLHHALDNDDNGWAVLKQFLADLIIKKIPTAEFRPAPGGQITVKPGAKLRNLYELDPAFRDR